MSVVSLHAVGSSEWQKIEGDELMPGVGYMKRDTSGGWGYFTWGAGLRRMSDYLLVGDYRRYNASWKSNAFFNRRHAPRASTSRSTLSTESGRSTGSTRPRDFAWPCSTTPCPTQATRPFQKKFTFPTKGARRLSSEMIASLLKVA